MIPTPPISRLWMTFMAGPNSLDDLRELWEPIRSHFSGLVATYHGDRNDAEALYLEDVKGEGAVIYLPYSRRHDFSRNAYLYCGPMRDGDYVMQCDSKERIVPDFITGFVVPFLADAEAKKHQGINLVYYHTKVLLYEYHESLRFQGTPHEGLTRLDGQQKAVDITPIFPNEDDVRPNVRAKTRGEFHWIGHYCAYWLHPFGSNHCLLGWEDRRDQLPARESRRLAFRAMVRAKGYPVTVEGVKELFSQSLDDETKGHINGELILHDYYRHAILGETWMTDKHDPSSIKPV